MLPLQTPSNISVWFLQLTTLAFQLDEEPSCWSLRVCLNRRNAHNALRLLELSQGCSESRGQRPRPQLEDWLLEEGTCLCKTQSASKAQFNLKTVAEFHLSRAGTTALMPCWKSLAHFWHHSTPAEQRNKMVQVLHQTKSSPHRALRRWKKNLLNSIKQL